MSQNNTKTHRKKGVPIKNTNRLSEIVLLAELVILYKIGGVGVG